MCGSRRDDGKLDGGCGVSHHYHIHVRSGNKNISLAARRIARTVKRNNRKIKYENAYGIFIYLQFFLLYAKNRNETNTLALR